MYGVCVQFLRFFPHPYSSSFPWQPNAFVDITIIHYETIIITHVYGMYLYIMSMCIAL